MFLIAQSLFLIEDDGISDLLSDNRYGLGTFQRLIGEVHAHVSDVAAV